MLIEDPNMAATPVTLDDQDAAAMEQFCQAMGAFTRGEAELDPAAAYAGLEAAGRVAGSVSGGGSGFGFSEWQGKLLEMPEMGRSLLQLEGGGQQVTLTLDSMGSCVGGVWINESESFGPGAAMFTVVGGALHVERPTACVVPLAGPIAGWTETPAFHEQPAEGSETLWGSGAVIAGVGAAAALAGAALAAKRFRDAKAARVAAEKAAAQKAAAERAAAERAAAEKAAAEKAAAEKAEAERAAAAAAVGAEKQWFYTKGGQPEGPVGDSEFRKLAPDLPADTLVWNQELPDWKPLSEAGLAPAVQRNWELAARSGPAAGKFFAVTSGMKLGRATDCDACLLDSMASRVHAILAEQADGFWIRDNNSSNGTLLNGAALLQPVRLSAGDVIKIGESELVFQEAEHKPSPAGSPMLTTVVLPPPEPTVREPVCPRCKAPARPGDRFCESCGQRMG